MCNRYFNFAGFITEKVLQYDIDDTDLHILSYMYMLQASKNIVRIEVNENYYYDIYKWLDSLGIKLSDFEEYYSYFQDWIKGRIRNVYKEGELCEG